MQSSSRSKQAGQAMLIAVLSLGGAILGATALAGFLTLYTIRSATNYRDSAQAILAADSGVNWVLYNYFNGFPDPAYPTLPNGTTVAVTCYNSAGVALASCDSSAVSAFSEGTDNTARRAFSLDLADATTTVP